jgi:hypothetical protein
MSYQTLTRQVRDRKLRPPCQACLTATERPNAIIEHRQVKRRNGIGWICPTRRRRGFLEMIWMARVSKELAQITQVSMGPTRYGHRRVWTEFRFRYGGRGDRLHHGYGR